MADIFDVIADETRRELLQILLENRMAGEKEMSVSELVARTGLSQPTVSKQLKVLRDSGVVVVREEGQHRLYHIDPTPLEALEDWVIPFLAVGSSSGDAPRHERLLGEDAKAAATSVGSAAATTVFQLTQALSGLTSGAKDAANRVANEAGKRIKKPAGK